MDPSESMAPIHMVTNNMENETQLLAPRTGGGPSEPWEEPGSAGLGETTHTVLTFESSFRIIQVRGGHEGKCQLRSCDPPAICLIHTGRGTASHYELVSSWCV